jgi:hypothetical protein
MGVVEAPGGMGAVPGTVEAPGVTVLVGPGPAGMVDWPGVMAPPEPG